MKQFSNLFFLLATLLASDRVLAMPWTMTPCGEEHRASWQKFADAMKSAKPGSSIYVPNPFPANDDQVIENFLYQHREAWEGTPFEKLSPEEQRFFSTINSKQAQFEVFRVSNWTPLRCSSERQRAFYFVVRVFDKTSGEEISRVAINDNGLLSRLRHKPLGHSLSDLPDLKATENNISARFGLQGKDSQYVTTWGTLDCDLLTPCVAVRNAGRAFVLRDSSLYEIKTNQGKYSLRRDLPPKERSRVAQRLDAEGKKLVSVGGDLFTIALPVRRVNP